MSDSRTDSFVSPVGPFPRFWPPRSAYVHVPFCRHRCGYCNFTLVARRDDLIEQYLQALAIELSWLGSAKSIETLYVGGGTPSHLPAEHLGHLIQILRQSFLLTEGGEFSVEANPLDLDVQRLAVLHGGGVTRLSLGVQSFSPRKLRLLERDHTPEVIRANWAVARLFIPELSLDLIFAAPGETLDEWREDLREALALEPDHVSVYGLTWEKGTAFWSRLQRGDLSSCPEELEREMYELAIEELTRAGFEHYEVSNFAQPGRRSRHNEVYWRGRTFFAAGPGAARYLDGRREVNHRSTTTYLQRVLAGESPVAESETLSPEESARERLVFGLRRLEGMDAVEFQRETGFSPVELGGAALQRYVATGLLRWHHGRLQMTREGLFISDSLWPELLVPVG